MRKDRLAVEESRLEMALNETKALHRSLVDQQAELEARESELARSLTAISRNESKRDACDEPSSPSQKDESSLRIEIQQLRDFNLELVSIKEALIFVSKLLNVKRYCCLNLSDGAVN